MSTSEPQTREPVATVVTVEGDTLTVELTDGRVLSVPIVWYPRLVSATDAERRNWMLIGRGEGIHWPDLDEDISVAALIQGRPSAESPASLKRWLASRAPSR